MKVSQARREGDEQAAFGEVRAVAEGGRGSGGGGREEAEAKWRAEAEMEEAVWIDGLGWEAAREGSFSIA